jgi:hypothetical protein
MSSNNGPGGGAMGWAIFPLVAASLPKCPTSVYLGWNRRKRNLMRQEWSKMWPCKSPGSFIHCLSSWSKYHEQRNNGAHCGNDTENVDPARIQTIPPAFAFVQAVGHFLNALGVAVAESNRLGP